MATAVDELASSDQIRDQIGATKANLAENLSFLEEQVMEKVETAKDTVQSTVNTIKKGVEKIRPSYQVQQHPLLFLGGSVLAGVAAGSFVSSRMRRNQSSLIRQGQSMLADEWSSLKSAAWTTLFQGLSEAAKEVLPKYKKAVNGVVHKVASRIENAA